MNTRKKILAIDAERFTKGLIKKMAADIAEARECELLSEVEHLKGLCNKKTSELETCKAFVYIGNEQNEQLLAENAILLEKVKIYKQLLH